MPRHSNEPTGRASRDIVDAVCAFAIPARAVALGRSTVSELGLARLREISLRLSARASDKEVTYDTKLE